MLNEGFYAAGRSHHQRWATGSNLSDLLSFCSSAPDTQIKIYAYIMKQIDSVDIDTKLDFLMAEAILKYKENENAK